MTFPVYIPNSFCDTFIYLFSLSVQLEHANDRYKLLDNQTSSIKRELEALRSKNLQLSNALSSHQAAINTTTHELLSSREKLSKAEVAVHTMKAERDLLESGEKRARSLYEELLREQRGHQVGSYYTGGVLLQLGYRTGTLWGLTTLGGRVLLQLGYVQVHCGGLTTLGGGGSYCS